MQKKKVNIDKEQSITIERLHYIMMSYKNIICVLAREFAENKSTETAAMIDKYRVDYQNAYIEFMVNVNTLIASIIGKVPSSIEYEFDFDNNEVELSW